MFRPAGEKQDGGHWLEKGKDGHHIEVGHQLNNYISYSIQYFIHKSST